MKKKKSKKEKIKRAAPRQGKRAKTTQPAEARRLSPALRRRQTARLRAQRSEEAMRQRIFRRRNLDASDKKAPKTLRTRGYYRFSRVYPGNVDAEGFRENAPDPARRRRQILLGALLSVLVFCAAYTGVRALRLISAAPPEVTQPDVQQEAYKPGTRILRFSRETLAGADADAMLQALRDSDCNAALFELKDTDGRLTIPIEGSLLADTDRIVVGAQSTFDALRGAGITLCGYISCFLDPAAANADPGIAVRRTDESGGVWKDNAGRGWLNPFSQPANAYLQKIVSAAVDAGFDVLILDNVAFSADSGTAQPYYPGEGAGSATRNSALVSFVNTAVKNAGGTKVILMAPCAAFDAAALPDAAGWGGHLLTTGAGAVCADARPSLQKKNLRIGEETFYDAAALPFPFVLAAAGFTSENLETAGSDARTFVCVENSDSLSDQIRAAALSGADGYVVW